MSDFLKFENKVAEELHKEIMSASWMANTTGNQEWEDKASASNAKRRKFASDPERFSQLKALLGSSESGSLEERQYQRLYQEAIENQIPDDILHKMITLESSLSSKFTNFRPQLPNGTKVNENKIRTTLLESTDSQERYEMWNASKKIGQFVEDDLLELIRLRNKAARSLGYLDHYRMSFELQELDFDYITAVFDDLKQITDEPFANIKQEIDQEIAQRLDLSVDQLRPWHYSDAFFQEAPAIPAANLTPYLQSPEADIVKLAKETFEACGMDIDDMLEKSDLYERENKHQYAFCTDIDRSGDVRVLCNLTQNQYWLETMLHEYGHAVYDKYISRELPFLLRTPAHILMTEAIAMFYGRLPKNKEWLYRFLSISPQQLEGMVSLIDKMQSRQMLILARWVLTFVAFERELYANPDQDLNALWWKLVQEIQYVNPPDDRDAPDWAAKMHFALAPVYYHNYLIGELIASQFYRYITKNIASQVCTPEAGSFFRDNVFDPGDRYTWQELLERATKEKLNPSYFVEQFVSQT